MKRALFPAVLLALASFLAAQNVSDSQQECSVSGTVVDSVNGQPLPGTQVFLRTIPTGGLLTRANSSSTDPNGRFAFDHLTPGRYIVRASRDGYITQGHGSRGDGSNALNLSPGQRADGLLISLVPGGVISGHITDETGKALSGIPIELMKVSTNDGKRDLHEAASASTRKTGDFRIIGVLPGSYFLRASPLENMAKVSSDRAYVPLFYPSANDQGSAAPIEVRPGDQLAGIDISFVPQKTVHVYGQVVDLRNSRPLPGTDLTLLSDDGSTRYSAGTSNSSGNFDLGGVVPGAYVLAAQGPTETENSVALWGRTSFDVGDANVTGLKILIGPGSDMAGHVRVEGKEALDLGKLSAVLEPQEMSAITSMMPEVDNAQIRPDGSFVFRYVPEGTYRLELFPFPNGYYLKTSGPADVLEAGFYVGRGHGSPPLDLTLSPATASIEGTVSNDDQPAGGAVVALVPEGKRRSERRYYSTANTDKMGKFTLRGLAPGEYRLFAFDELDRRSLMDSNVLAEYEDQGQRIYVEDGAHSSTRLQLIVTGQ